ncbi:MAG: MerR family transcriptional regulator [Lachnospiraceae bacterium]|nr:MerR family transcriptional regulator [Lachnospiraceae bacterium]
MEKRMTSGEIAKKTGISQKTVRLYDEKGLLKPSGYSEGNYRLYDRSALAVLEKIIALKQIGFSLEEIHDNLEAEKDVDITEVLTRQLKILETKKYEIEKAIASVNSVLLRQAEPDWDSVAETVKTMQMDQGADVNHYQALLHTAGEDWYVTIYKSLHLQKNAKVLDLGCGYGKLWRNSWSRIPAGVTVDGYDLHGSWADDFAGYVEQNKENLAVGTKVNLYFEDVETDATWEEIERKIGQREGYDLVIAHYLLDFMKDGEAFLKRVAGVLTTNGMCSVNGAGVSREHAFWQEIFTRLRLRTDFLIEREAKARKKREEFQTMLFLYFSKVENVTLGSVMRYTDANELFTYLLERYPEEKKYLTEQEAELKAYFVSEIQGKGDFLIPKSTDFKHCYK